MGFEFGDSVGVGAGVGEDEDLSAAFGQDVRDGKVEAAADDGDVGMRGEPLLLAPVAKVGEFGIVYLENILGTAVGHVA